MARIIADISVSLDSYVTGPHPGPDNGLGTGGEALHTWAFSDDPVDQRILCEGTTRSGAVVLGRRLFDVVDGPGGWNDETGYGAGQVGTRREGGSPACGEVYGAELDVQEKETTRRPPGRDPTPSCFAEKPDGVPGVGRLRREGRDVGT